MESPTVRLCRESGFESGFHGKETLAHILAYNEISLEETRRPDHQDAKGEQAWH